MCVLNFTFEKLYMTDVFDEHCGVGVPFPQGSVREPFDLAVKGETGEKPVQFKVTSRWPDGSVRWLYARFLADLKGNAKTVYQCGILPGTEPETKGMVMQEADGLTIDTGAVVVRLQNGAQFVKEITAGGITYGAASFDGPVLRDEEGNTYALRIDGWKIIEDGPLCAVVQGEGAHCLPDGQERRCRIKVTAYANKPWIELAYTLVNTSYGQLAVKDLSFYFRPSTPAEQAASCVAWSNYATSYRKSETGEPVEKVIDAEMLLFEGNEHMAEVFYGTLFADYNTPAGGVCATVYQAQQNYPKAVAASKEGLKISLVPDGLGPIVMEQGMARQQRFLLHFHSGEETPEQLNDRSIRYQMPDRPLLEAAIYRAAGVFEDVFVEKKNMEVERRFIRSIDKRAGAYGMLHWGDSPSADYTQQGRGGGATVWINNEYDFSHACTLMYARTGQRRFMDYMLVSSRHWIDVDICHFSDDPLVQDGQWEHAKRHCIGSHMACSHEWVQGLLDYYHLSGDEDGLEAAMGIGGNVMRLLNSPTFQEYGALHARESGWALRTLGDLYKETADEYWLEKCEWIVGHFESWEKKYGGWLAPYTDNTVVRVVFMISIAVGSLMRYYRIRPSEKVKGMILRAVDDMMENCRVETGMFYYKELPSLQKTSGPMILEALAYAYEFTGDTKYLHAGLPTFQEYMREVILHQNLTKTLEEDAILLAGECTKHFAQSFLPVVSFYKAASEANISLLL